MTSFRWENDKEFISLANLLSLRNGACLGPRDRRDDETEDDMDSVHVFTGEENDLKRRFLDRFAEVMSRDKGGKHVASVALSESRNELNLDVSSDTEKATLLVARNEEFKDVDRNFCHKAEKLMATIAKTTLGGTKDNAAETALWEELLQHNEPRLEYYAMRFQGSVAAFTRDGFLDNIPPYCIAAVARDNSDVQTFCEDENIGPYSKATHNVYMKFAQEQIRQLRDVLCSESRRIQLRLLTERAYSVRHMVSVKIFVSSCSNYPLARKLLSDILFLGRLRSCYFTLLRAAETIRGIHNLSIVLVDRPPLRAPPTSLPSLAEVFRWLNMSLDTAAVQTLLYKQATVAVVEQRFMECQTESCCRPFPTHAEIQLIFYIAQTTSTQTILKEVYPYIGCSKLCCFLCSTFIQSFGQGGPFFKTRGCHGKIYPFWSLPDTDGLQGDVAMELYSALRKTLHLLAHEMKKPIALTPLHVPESSAGITQSYSASTSYIHVYRKELAIQCQFDALRQKLSGELIRSLIEDMKANNSGVEVAQYAYLPTRFGKCARCSRKTARRCSKCSRPWLCGLPCERAYDFYEHNFTCAIGRSLDAADYLERACWRNEIPDDDTFDEFGFSRFTSSFDHRNLLGVFIGLTRMGVGNKEFRRWKEEGTLIASIVSAYEASPDYSWDGHYRWFQEHLASLHPNPQSRQPDVFATVRSCLDDSDRLKDLHELTPEAKRKSFLLYGLLYNGWHPDPSHLEISVQDLYFRFGFCICCNPQEEQVLA
ncbi:hypothetical protein ID866_8592, partial [Astraeus odoratus]